MRPGTGGILRRGEPADRSTGGTPAGDPLTAAACPCPAPCPASESRADRARPSGAARPRGDSTASSDIPTEVSPPMRCFRRGSGLNRDGGKSAESSSASRRSGSKRSEEHTSELQSQSNLVCRLLLEKKKKNYKQKMSTH